MSEWKLEDHCDDPVKFPGIITFDGWCAQEEVQEMRHLREANPSEWTYKKLGQRYGMSISGVFGICNHITWQGVN